MGKSLVFGLPGSIENPAMFSGRGGEAALRVCSCFLRLQCAIGSLEFRNLGFCIMISDDSHTRFMLESR